jgi:hypothetical protein
MMFSFPCNNTRWYIYQGLDMGRRLCIFGFCRSIEMLSDVVEDTVLEHGGEVIPWILSTCIFLMAEHEIIQLVRNIERIIDSIKFLEMHNQTFPSICTSS